MWMISVKPACTPWSTGNKAGGAAVPERRHRRGSHDLPAGRSGGSRQKKQLDVSKLAALGWRAGIPLEDGLKQTVAQFRDSFQQQLLRL
jgi:nucleoside-diphosphate-sugar epimerase